MVANALRSHPACATVAVNALGLAANLAVSDSTHAPLMPFLPTMAVALTTHVAVEAVALQGVLLLSNLAAGRSCAVLVRAIEVHVLEALPPVDPGLHVECCWLGSTLSASLTCHEFVMEGCCVCLR